MGKSRTKLDEITINEIVKLYKNGDMSLEQLGRRYNVSPCTISHYVKRYGIEVVNRQNAINFDVEKDIIPLYEKGYSLTQISRIVNNSRQCIAKQLRKFGFEYVNRHNMAKFNEHVFDVIDTEEKAYWLGFIYADGNISSIGGGKKPRYRFELDLKISDIEHLFKFNTFMGYAGNNVKIGTTKCGGKLFYRCRFGVTNKHLWNVLNSYGCTPNKSLTLQFPDKSIFKDEGLIRHFLRGYFDGDGCITYSIHKLKNGDIMHSGLATVIGTIDFLNAFSENSVESTNIKPLNRDSQYTFVIYFSQKRTKKLISILYDDSKIYLNRKYNRAMFFKHSCRSSKELGELLSGEIGEQTRITGERRDNLNDSE